MRGKPRRGRAVAPPGDFFYSRDDEKARRQELRGWDEHIRHYTWRAAVRLSAERAARNGDLFAAGLFAALSFLAAGGEGAVLPYIQWDVLALLLALMLVLAGLRRMGAVEAACLLALESCRTVRAAAFFFTAACFVSSMFITNDAALLVFVPESILLLSRLGLKRYVPFVVVLETLAANLGSMLLPSGNPQNLYLYFHYQMEFGEFLAVTAPLAAVSGLLLFLAARRLPSQPIPPIRPPVLSLRGGKLLLYLFLFLLVGAVILRLCPVYMLAVLFAAVLLADRSLFGRADWKLLFLFVCLFVGVGNLERQPFISELVRSGISGWNLEAAVLLSQCISNVPAAVLLSGYTDDGAALVAGTNIGGLGTLIASMASLISFRCYTAMEGHDTRGYLKLFTLWNLAFLAALYGAARFLFL